MNVPALTPSPETVRVYSGHRDDPAPEVLVVPDSMVEAYIQENLSDPTFRTQLVRMTPTLAKALLLINTENRNASRVGIKRFRADLESGDWERTHQGLGVYRNGALSDGQTRLAALVEAGVTIEMLVTWGLTKKAGSAIDRHRPRSDADSIKIGGLSNWIGQTEVSVIKMIAQAHTKSNQSPSAAQIAELGEYLKDRVTFTALAFTSRKKSITTAPVMAAVAMARPYVDEYRLLEFAEVMLNGMPVSHDAMDDAGAIRLREKLIDDRGRIGQSVRREILLKTQRAIKAFAEHDHIQRLNTPSGLIYRVEGIEDYL